MGRGGTALGIIGIILAAGAGGFAFVTWNGQNIANSDLDNLTDELNNLTDELNNLPRILVVGIWNTLEDNLNYAPHNLQNDWLFEFGDNNLNNTDFISV